MRIIEELKRDVPTLSFEVFPPKTDTAFENVRAAVEEIAKLQPSFMSVTYGAGGGTSRYTLDIAKKIRERRAMKKILDADDQQIINFM